ncbi:MAG: GPR endopeptidase, partial [Bacilli bacterium]
MMAHEINLDDYKIRTDLLIETIENAKELDIKIEDNQRTEDDITITIVDIAKKHESIINRKAGRYITIEFADITDFNNQEKVLKIFADELGSFLEYLKIPPDYTCLVIGL